MFHFSTIKLKIYKQFSLTRLKNYWKLSLLRRNLNNFKHAKTTLGISKIPSKQVRNVLHMLKNSAIGFISLFFKINF